MVMIEKARGCDEFHRTTNGGSYRRTVEDGGEEKGSDPQCGSFGFPPSQTFGWKWRLA
jgi:hypothetical protein